VSASRLFKPNLNSVRFSWSWVLQDIMVISLVLNLISLTVFRSYKTCMIALTFFLAYDIFMVYFLPLITHVTHSNTQMKCNQTKLNTLLNVCFFILLLTQDYQINKSLCFGMQTLRYSGERMQVIFIRIKNGFASLRIFGGLDIKGVTNNGKRGRLWKIPSFVFNFS
jgi:hypothetical protein